MGNCPQLLRTSKLSKRPLNPSFSLWGVGVEGLINKAFIFDIITKWVCANIITTRQITPLSPWRGAGGEAVL